MKIGILQTGQSPDTLRPEQGDYPGMFERLLEGHGFEFKTWLVEEMDFPDSPQDADGWLITGSKHGVYEDHPFIPPLEQLVRDAMAARVPVVGICFGHQLMAQALGGKVEKFPGGWAIGPQTYDIEGTTMTVNAWHQDQIITPPPGARVIASNGFCRYAGLAYDDLGWSVQPHPEFGDAFIRGLIRTRAVGVVPDAQLRDAEAALGQPLDSPAVGDRIAEFLKRAAGRANS